MRCYAPDCFGLSQDSLRPNETSGSSGDEIIPPDLGGPAKLGQTHINVSAEQSAVTKKFRAPGLPVEPLQCVLSLNRLMVEPWLV